MAAAEGPKVMSHRRNRWKALRTEQSPRTGSNVSPLLARGFYLRPGVFAYLLVGRAFSQAENALSVGATMRRACGRWGVRSPLWSPLEFCGRRKRFYRVRGRRRGRVRGHGHSPGGRVRLGRRRWCRLRDRLTRHPDRPPGAARRTFRDNPWPSPRTIPPMHPRIFGCAFRCLQ